ncbi:MAG: hypothetical protein QOJ14_1689, partial [Thermoleophilaceae bacterium]|nr:hypothetical protein [Thermoleophilaceae bacterium]
MIWLAAVEHLHSQGHEVTVLATDFRLPDPEAGLEAPVPVVRALPWYWRDHAFPRLGLRERVSIERRAHRVLRAALADTAPDVVSWWSMGGMPLSLMQRVRDAGVPSAAVVCDDWLLYAPTVDAGARASARRPRAARVVRRATGMPTLADPGGLVDSWVFLSRTLLDAARDAGIEPRDARVVHRGIDPSLFRDAPARPWAWRLLYLGRIDERKGIDLAIEALVHLPAEATLAVAGPGDQEQL